MRSTSKPQSYSGLKSSLVLSFCWDCSDGWTFLLLLSGCIQWILTLRMKPCNSELTQHRALSLWWSTTSLLVVTSHLLKMTERRLMYTSSTDKSKFLKCSLLSFSFAFLLCFAWSPAPCFAASTVFLTMSTHKNLKDSNQARKAQKFRDQASLEHRLISRPTTNF